MAGTTRTTWSVTTVELSVYENTVPLVAGYLETYARQDPRIDAGFTFGIYARAASADTAKIVDQLAERDSDIYAFSCYIWNMGAQRRVIDGLRERRPDAIYVLGGPQVMNKAADFVPPHAERMVVCNGEGERSFQELLRQLDRDTPDLAQVPGISFWHDGTLITTDAPPRIQALDDIPSPFDAGVFDGGEYTFAILETNRGCPYHCGFCFWGAATNSKVHSFAEERVKRDIRWLAANCVSSVFIADANWGLSPRDVELSKHIVACKEELGFPTTITIAAAKNRPDRVADITTILVDGGLVTSQPISLQTLNPDALDLVERQNIKEDRFISLQRTLGERGISSFIELIWPLPGETLASFREGVARLCRLGADTITIYPQLLLPNTSLHERREVLGIEVERAPDPAAEADIVVATRWVDRADCLAGTWFEYAVHALYNTRGTYYLARYLDRVGMLSYADFFSSAAEHIKHAGDDVSRFIAGSISAADNYNLANMGRVAHLVLHQHRAQFDRLLLAFAQASPWWTDRAARAALDLDLIARPYIYREPCRVPAVPATELSWDVRDQDSAVVEFPVGLTGLPATLGLAEGPVTALRIEHPRGATMPPPREGAAAGYCHLMIQRIKMLLPRLTPDGAPR